MKLEPMNPAPPVTSSFIVLIVSEKQLRIQSFLDYYILKSAIEYGRMRYAE
jgi:hypothetical protein